MIDETESDVAPPLCDDDAAIVAGLLGGLDRPWGGCRLGADVLSAAGGDALASRLRAVSDAGNHVSEAAEWSGPPSAG